MEHAFDPIRKDGVYHAIFRRRDVRRNFKSNALPDDIIARILLAAHHAPSVGYMQPWNFILITDLEIRKKIKSIFDEANQKAAQLFKGQKRELYQSLKLEGILEAPLNLCVTCDRERNGPVVLGTTSQQNMDIYSAVCAVQNIWLAARSEGVGVGWVSILDALKVKEVLNIPEKLEVVAYLCLGFVKEFSGKPDLENANWLPRLDISDLIFKNTFHTKIDDSLKKSVQQMRQELLRGENTESF